MRGGEDTGGRKTLFSFFPCSVRLFHLQQQRWGRQFLLRSFARLGCQLYFRAFVSPTLGFRLSWQSTAVFVGPTIPNESCKCEWFRGPLDESHAGVTHPSRLDNWMQVMQCGADVGGVCGVSPPRVDAQFASRPPGASWVGQPADRRAGGGAGQAGEELEGTRWPPGSLAHQHLSRPHTPWSRTNFA